MKLSVLNNGNLLLTNDVINKVNVFDIIEFLEGKGYYMFDGMDGWNRVENDENVYLLDGYGFNCIDELINKGRTVIKLSTMKKYEYED